MNITSIFDRCHCSIAAETPVKYESDSLDLTYHFTKSKLSLMKKLTEWRFSAPHPWPSSPGTDPGSLLSAGVSEKHLSKQLLLWVGFLSASCTVWITFMIWYTKMHLVYMVSFLQDTHIKYLTAYPWSRCIWWLSFVNLRTELSSYTFVIAVQVCSDKWCWQGFSQRPAFRLFAGFYGCYP